MSHRLRYLMEGFAKGFVDGSIFAYAAIGVGAVLYVLLSIALGG